MCCVFICQLRYKTTKTRFSIVQCPLPSLRKFEVSFEIYLKFLRNSNLRGSHLQRGIYISKKKIEIYFLQQCFAAWLTRLCAYHIQSHMLLKLIIIMECTINVHRQFQLAFIRRVHSHCTHRNANKVAKLTNEHLEQIWMRCGLVIKIRCWLSFLLFRSQFVAVVIAVSALFLHSFAHSFSICSLHCILHLLEYNLTIWKTFAQIGRIQKFQNELNNCKNNEMIAKSTINHKDSINNLPTFVDRVVFCCLAIWTHWISHCLR